MTEDRKPNEEDLFSDDDAVFEDNDGTFDEGDDSFAEPETSAQPDSPGRPGPKRDAEPQLDVFGPDDPAPPDDEASFLDDDEGNEVIDEFVIDFGEEDFEDDVLEPPVAEAAPERRLESMFGGAEGVGEPSEFDEENGALFAAGDPGAEAHEFEGVRAKPEFVEDRAGWHGDDVNLADLLGESIEGDADEDRDPYGLESGIDDDPFAIEDVEVESLGGVPHVQAGDDSSESWDGAQFIQELGGGSPAGHDEGDELGLDSPEEFESTEELPDLELFDDRAAAETEADEQSFSSLEPVVESDDAWSPLAAGESWVMGEGPEAAADADEYAELPDPIEDEEPAAAGFGAGRNDEYSFGPSEGDAGFDGQAPEEDWNLGPDEVPEGEQEEEYVDPIYGDVGAGIDAVTEESVEEGELGLVEDYGYAEDDGEFDESYIDTTPQSAQVVGGGRVHRFPWLRVAAALAVTIGIGGGGVVALRPDWFGLGSEPLNAHRVEVARPRIDLTLAAPVPAAPETTPEPGGGETTDPVVPPVVVVTPGDPDPDQPPVVVVVPVGGGDPEPPVDPVGPSVPIDEPVTPPVVPRPRAVVAFEPLTFGESLEIRAPADAEPLRHAGIQDVVPGIRAYAQLRNEEIFIGVVKRVEATYVTLDLEPGEVSLQREDLSALTALESADAKEFTAVEHGYVRLPSQARLWGRILRNATTDNVILRTEDARITIQAHDVVQVSGSSKSGTTLVEDDDRWLDQLARQKIRGTSGAEPPMSDADAKTRTTQPAGPPRGR